MCAPSPPPPADYVGAAKEQGAANVEAAIASGKINNPNVINPYGTQKVTWSSDGKNSIPTVTQTFSPTQQKLFDQSNELKKQLGLIGLKGTDSLKGLIGTGVNFDNAPDLSSADFTSGAPAIRGTNFTSGAPALRSTNFTSGAPALRSTDFSAGGPKFGNTNFSSGATDFRGSNFVGGAPSLPGNAESIRNQAISSMMKRVDEDTGNQRREANSELIASGIRPGSKAYNDRMNIINRQYNDARQQAILAGGQEAQRLYGMDMGRRQQYVGEREAMSQEARAQRGQQVGEKQATEDALRAQRAQYTGERQAAEAAQRAQRSMYTDERQAAEAAQRAQRSLYTGERENMFKASGQARELATREAQQKFGATAEARRQYITEALSKRQIPLNEITALMSGSQVSNPFAVPGYLGVNGPQASPIFAAQNALGGYNTDVFNAQSAAASNQQSGAMAAGTTAAMYGMMMY